MKLSDTTRSRLRGTLLTASSALALIIAVDQSANAACSVTTNPSLPYTDTNGNCTTFNAFTGTGAVANDSSISATGTAAPTVTGIGVVNGSTITGSITNNGSITSAVSNAVTTDGGNGILVEGSTVTGSITNATGVTISGGGIFLNGATVGTANSTVNAIVNNGTITSTYYPSVGIEISQSTVNGNVVNGVNGNITGVSTGIIQIVNGGTLNGSVENFGTITNNYGSNYTTPIPDIGAGIYVYAPQIAYGGTGPETITGSIVNETSGKITGGFGVQVFATNTDALVTIEGSVTNAGKITAGYTGIQIGSATIDGAPTNSGTIGAVQNGIQLINLASTPGELCT
jgi:hypothetical protein